MKTLYIAGNHKEYLDYLEERQIPRNTTAYATNIEQVIGREYDMLIRVGTWYERWNEKDIDKLIISIKGYVDQLHESAWKPFA